MTTTVESVLFRYAVQSFDCESHKKGTDRNLYLYVSGFTLAYGSHRLVGLIVVTSPRHWVHIICVMCILWLFHSSKCYEHD